MKVSPVKLSWFSEVQLPEITDIRKTMSDLCPSVRYGSALVSFLVILAFVLLVVVVTLILYFKIQLKGVPGRRYYHFDNYHAGSRSERLQANNRAA